MIDVVKYFAILTKIKIRRNYILKYFVRIILGFIKTFRHGRFQENFDLIFLENFRRLRKCPLQINIIERFTNNFQISIEVVHFNLELEKKALNLGLKPGRSS